jgi:hypothetical protein
MLRLAVPKSFSRCFLNSKGLATLNCDTLVNDACTSPDHSKLTNSLDFYVAYNIYSINQAFNTYFNAIPNANTLASENIPAIIQLLDPPKQQNVLLNDILTALSVGLSFLVSENPIIDALVKGATQAIAVNKFLFPTGTLDSQNAQFRSLEESLGAVVQQLQRNVNSAFPAALANASNFLAFAYSGAFSQPTNESLFADTAKLLTGLNTYVVSQGMQANNILLARAPTIDINEWVADGAVSNYAIDGCGKGYDPLGICDAFYYNQAQNTTYSFVKIDDPSQNYHDAMETIFGNWTSPDLLIVNGAACADIGSSQHLGNLISATPTGVASACLANMKVCTWSQDPSNFQTEIFTDCDNTNGWQDDSCGGDGGVKVPAGYIGPEMSAENGEYGACR